MSRVLAAMLEINILEVVALGLAVAALASIWIGK
jgi:hypothetical protein